MKTRAADGSLVFTTAGTLAMLVALILYAFLLAGIWIPDLFSSTSHTVAQVGLENGHRFLVSQHWDGGYETVFVHVFPDGTSQTNYLEGSARKRWRARIFAGEKERRATVVLSKFQKKVVRW